MKNFIISASAICVSLCLNAQYIDSAKLNLTTNPPSLEIHGIMEFGRQITHIECSISDTILVSIYSVECPGFTVLVPFDTVLSYSNLPTIPTEIVVYTILDTNTTSYPNCGPNAVFDTLYTYTSFQSNVGLEKKTLSSALSLFPNPAKDQVELSGITFNEISEIKLIDLSGRLVRKFPLDNFVLDLSGVDKGNYFIQLQTEYGPRTEKLVVD